MTTTSQNGFKIDQPIPDIEGGSKSPRVLNNPVFNWFADRWDLGPLFTFPLHIHPECTKFQKT